MRTFVLAAAALALVGCAEARTSAAQRVAVAPPPGACSAVAPPAARSAPEDAEPASLPAPGAQGCAAAAAPTGAPRDGR